MTDIRELKTYTVTIACNVRAYATVEIEAADEEAAQRRAEELVDELKNPSNYKHESPELEDVVFNPEYDTLNDYELLDDLRMEG